jgi:septal ring factor EnvC (AmiA/AmiB activator)
MIAVLLVPTGVRPEESPQSVLRKEKARLTEMRKRAEKAADELGEAIRKEKASRHKVNDYRKRLARQRQLIARIDRKLSDLSRDMEKAEAEVRAVAEERAGTRRRMERVAALAFAHDRMSAVLFPLDIRAERLRYLTRILLDAEADRYDRLGSDRERKASALSGIERKVQLSERRISREKKVGESLRSRREEEETRLARIRAQKESKEKELQALRSRLARMEALVARIERRVREEERRASRKEKEKGPSKFSGVPGGLVAPVRGKVVGPFGKFRDPVFDVEVENNGVEIEANTGSPIRSIGKGKVVFSGAVAGFGNVLIIQHGSGLFSVYGKAESFSVAQGQVVGPGQNIGRLPENAGGKSVLYLELRAAGTAIDPVPVIPLSR